MWRYAVELKQDSNSPNLIWVHKPNSESNLCSVDIKINSDGLRDYEYAIKKEKNTFRVLVLGDSIAFGWGVNFNDTFAKLIEKEMNEKSPFEGYSKYEVINFGVGNYNTVMELNMLKEKGLKYNPDLVILEYYINDAELINSDKKSWWTTLKYTYIYAFLWGKYQSTKINLLESNYKNFYLNLYKEDFGGKTIAEESLYGLIKILKEKEIPLLIVIFPEFHNFKDYRFSEVTDFVSEIAASQNVSVLDLLPYYINYEPESIWLSSEDAHPNALGHRIVADAVMKHILEHEQTWGVNKKSCLI